MIATPATWLKLTASVGGVFLAFHLLADALGSDRGQAGVQVGAVVVALTLAVDRALFGSRGRAARLALGFDRAALLGLVVSATICLVMLAAVPIFSLSVQSNAIWRPTPPLHVLGLAMQAGVAEELLFRGYLFGRLRDGRSFGRAAFAAMPPFVLVHLMLFFTMPWPVALAAVLLAAVMSFPFARLYEIGGHTIWAPALLHFVVQGTVKIVEFPLAGATTFPIVWMLVAAIVPWLVFLVRRR